MTKPLRMEVPADGEGKHESLPPTRSRQPRDPGHFVSADATSLTSRNRRSQCANQDCLSGKKGNVNCSSGARLCPACCSLEMESCTVQSHVKYRDSQQDSPSGDDLGSSFPAQRPPVGVDVNTRILETRSPHEADGSHGRDAGFG